MIRHYNVYNVYNSVYKVDEYSTVYIYCVYMANLSTPMQLGVEVGHLPYVVGDHHKQRQRQVLLL